MRVLLGYFVAAAFASLALPPISFVPAVLGLAWPAYHLAMASSQRQAFWIVGAMGLGWFFASTHWTAHSLLVGEAEFWYLLPLAAIGVPTLLTIFWAVAGAMAWRLAETRLGRLLWLVVALSVSEFGRGFIATGFPWNAPGYVFSASIASLQPAAWFGLYGLNIFVFAAALAPAIWAFGRRRLAVGLLLIPIVLTVAGHARLTTADQHDQATIKTIRLVQPNISQEAKWDRSQRATHLRSLIALSTEQKPLPQLIVWPETAFTGFINSDPLLLRETANQATPFDGHLITGLLRVAEGDRLYNSAALLDGDGVVQQVYDKRRLVPFGEFAPFRDWLHFVDAFAGPADFSAGQINQLFEVPHYGSVQMSICYESIFSGGVIIGDSRPDMVINITNDGWFGRTLGPWQHLAQAQMRAVEEGLPMIRVANTGVTAVFDSFGRTKGLIPHGEKGMLDIQVPSAIEMPLFARHKHLPFFLLLVMAAFFGWRLDGQGSLGQ